MDRQIQVFVSSKRGYGSVSPFELAAIAGLLQPYFLGPESRQEGMTT